MASVSSQGNLQDNLNRIANELQLDIANLQPAESQDLCFSTVYSLCKAEKWGSIDKIKGLIEDLVNTTGETILACCIYDENKILFDRLIERKIAVHKASNHGNFPIHIAAEVGNLEFVKALFVHNDLEAKNAWGQTPLHLAAIRGHAKLVDYLLTSSPHSSRHIATWNYGTTSFQLPPLALSIIGGNIASMDHFMKSPHVKLNTTLKGIGNLLHLAVFFQQHKILERLLTLYLQKIEIQIEGENEMGLTPLMLAAYIGNMHALQYLIKKGAKLEAKDHQGNTALHWAVLGNQMNAVTLLFDNKADIIRVENDNNDDPARLAEHLENESLRNYLINLKKAGSTLRLAFEARKPKFLVFKGGGIRGLAHGGVVQGLEKYGMMSSVTHIAGTSAGSMMGGLVALGYEGPQIIEIFKTIKFMDLFDNPAITPIKDLVQSKRTIEKLKVVTREIFNPIGTVAKVVSILKGLWHTGGICKGEVARKLVEKYIFQKTGIEYMTFGELRKEIQQGGKSYKHFHAIVTKMGPNSEILDINSEDPQWDNIIISDAIRGSMSIPGIFEPHRLHIKIIKEGVIVRVPHPEQFVVVDGGILHNLALECFDRKKYVTPNDTVGDENFPVFNNRTLGISLFEPEDKIPKLDKEPKNLKDLLINIASIYSQAEMLIRKLNPYNSTRIIEASTCGIGTLEFNLSDDAKDVIVSSGFKSVEDHVSKQSSSSFLETVETVNVNVPAATVSHTVEQMNMQYSQLYEKLIGTEPGLYVQGQCDAHASCPKYGIKQWIPKLLSTSKPQMVDIGEIQADLSCSCHTTMKKIEKIALTGCSSLLSYRDEQGRHEKSIVATNGVAEVIELATTSIKYMVFKDISTNK